jgi:hypothetical protein
MNLIQLLREITGIYSKHGWQLRRALLRPESLAETNARSEDLVEEFQTVEKREAEIDALWFARPSAQGREAWELRHVAEAPFALFEMFEPDEEEEDREDVRREMEARMTERVNGKMDV